MQMVCSLIARQLVNLPRNRNNSQPDAIGKAAHDSPRIGIRSDVVSKVRDRRSSRSTPSRSGRSTACKAHRTLLLGSSSGQGSFCGTAKKPHRLPVDRTDGCIRLEVAQVSESEALRERIVFDGSELTFSPAAHPTPNCCALSVSSHSRPRLNAKKWSCNWREKKRAAPPG